MDGLMFLGFFAALIFIVLVGRVMMVPLRHVFKLLVNGIIGGILLWLVNFFGATFSVFVPINIATVLIAGFLGIPGVILLVALRTILT